LIEKAGLRENHGDEDAGDAGADSGTGIGMENGYGTTLDGFRLTTEDVERAIMSLKNKFSVGADGVSSRTVKEMAKFFAKLLTPLFNKSLAQGVFPEWLKMAIIVPAAKGGDAAQMTNYRPISLFPCISKVFEKCVKEKILNYLNHIDFMAKQQFGFMKNKSTDTALFTHITNIVSSIEKYNAAVGVYLDLAKAFDTVNHKLMIKKLSEIGIRGSLLDWFASYLTGRQHRVRINNTLSTNLKIKHGVPQGSVLGPLLFIIYINEIFLLPLRGIVLGYADDTSLLYSAATAEQINVDFKHDEKILTAWFRKNFLHLNTNKCKGIIYSYMKIRWARGVKLKIENEELEITNKVKYLGLIFDEKLTWKEHSLELQAKLRKLNFLFFHLKNYFNIKHLKNIYVPLYESVLSYGIIHWGACRHIKPIKVLQNKACRTILSLPPRSTESAIYRERNLVRLEEVHRRRLLMFLYKNKDFFQLHFNKRTVTRKTVSRVAAYPYWKKEHSRMQARYQGAKLFNLLAPEIRDEGRLSTYKRLVRSCECVN
jgi:hypothetical protein